MQDHFSSLRFAISAHTSSQIKNQTFYTTCFEVFYLLSCLSRSIQFYRFSIETSHDVCPRDVEAEAEAGSESGRSGGSGPFSVEVEAEAEKIYRFRFYIGYLI